MEKICVAVRVRPPVAVSQEISNGNHWRVEDNHISLLKSDGTPISGVSYAFDHVFDESCTNARVYELLTKDIIHAAVEGFNGTAFAYGQTSSGKTFTMNGSETDPGIIHRAVKDIFNKIQMMSDREFLIRVSYMEIYNEEINDLFAVENQKLQIHESLERGIFVAGLREEIVNNAEQVLELIATGEVNRHFGETNMNIRSSRSHTIFRMVIESKGKDSNSSTNYSTSDAIRVSVLGHIPYRDSKLTRILQPALGGNAKTSIICTIAPEEVHIDETKGTLQFASRAKRITNCAQVNEILTDAALLKRQKLEIEELSKKLQGSRAEVLEQEILKLRNEMLKYELEREKLEMQLEEERKSHKERDQCIREQQMRIDNLSNLVTFPECDKNAGLGQNSGSQCSKEEFNDSSSITREDVFRTPSIKAAPNAFVAKRSNYSRHTDYSPLPDTLSNVADEDTWLKMNKGYIADLDSIQMTPARKVPFPSSDMILKEVENLTRQLELITEEKNELESFVPDDESSTAKLLSSTSEIVISLFSNLESYLFMDKDNHEFFPRNDSLVQEHCKVLSESIRGTITSLVASEKLAIQNKEVKNTICGCDHKGSTQEGETASSKEKLSYELDTIKEKYNDLEKKLDLNNQLLEVSREKYTSLERELQLLKEERDSLLESSQKLALVTDQKENILKDLNSEARRRKDLEEQIKQFSVAFASRQRSFTSFQSEFKSKIEKLRSLDTVSASKSLGC
ncbi:hypothetical protein GH714_011009 [Hevea brasiliensis]|uniref:Kinesin motor domain-containing protein n=1 Tax=Hevea brasiliensis TaxID=3981 RepID=A0A6A6NGG8_HEVBR|nr:hypothetical protein GH714_011009 [Hevea brasiliensis]